MENVMFRYILKYVGTYRVLPVLLDGEEDLPQELTGGLDKSFDDFYIPCIKGIIKHTYQPYYMMWYSDKLTVGRNVKNELESKSIPICNYEETSSEVMFWFKDEDMQKVAAVVKPKTKGKDISPLSVKNIEQKPIAEKCIVPLKAYQEYAEIVNELGITEKMQFARVAAKDFDKFLVQSYGKKFNPTKERKAMKCGYKEFVYSLGVWKEFIQNTQKLYNDIYGGK